MAVHDQTDSFSSTMTNGRSLFGTRLMRDLALAIAAGVALALVWTFSRLSYETIAALERISDPRAAQVASMYGWWLAMLWVVGVVWMLSAQRCYEVNDARISRPQRRFLGLMLGVCTSSVLFGTVLMGVASVPFIVVTPPAAWLIMLAASLLAGLIGLRKFDKRTFAGNR